MHVSDGLAEVCRILERDSERYFGHGGAVVQPIRRLDGPFSQVLRIRVTTPAGDSNAYIKVFLPRGPEPKHQAKADWYLTREYQASSALYGALRDSTDLGALRPIACLPAHRAIVTAEVAGRPLSTVLVRADLSPDELAQIGERIGRWTRTYQQLGPAADRVELTDRREYIDERLRALEGEILTREDRAEVLAHCDRLFDQIGSTFVDAVQIHADLTPANVIIDTDGRVTVLDFAMAKTGTRLHDLSHLYFHLALGAVRRPRRAALLQLVQRAAIRGYDPGTSPRDPLFRLMLWQHAVCHVALLAERRLPIVGPMYRLFVRSRWRQLATLLRLRACDAGCDDRGSFV